MEEIINNLHGNYEDADILKLCYELLDVMHNDKGQFPEVQNPLGVALDAIRDAFIWQTHGTSRQNESIETR